VAELEGHLALVTGAGRGIGRGCALALARAGAEVVLVSRSAGELDAVAEEVHSLGGSAQACMCDVTDTSQVQKLFSTVARVDVLVNAAGGNVPEPFVDVSEANLDKVLSLNVRSVFLVSQAAVRLMLERKSGGAIVTIGSQMGHVGAANRSVYCTTKHAIEGLTKAMAVELAPYGIRVNSVAPTFVETPMTAPFFANERFRRDVLARIPLGRLGSVDDVAAAVVFLASPKASLITGTSLIVDGGWTAQ
jgi:NAD(P)-dependent dehydrogenase (short-subunit alcohol dehydrogenase family)